MLLPRRGEFRGEKFVGHYLTQAEGFILGLGSKLFTIAGPVILYGLITSSLVGLIYYLVMVLGG